MTTVHRHRALGILLAGLSGVLFTWQADIHDFAYRALVAGAASACAGAALFLYGQVVRGSK